MGVALDDDGWAAVAGGVFGCGVRGYGLWVGLGGGVLDGVGADVSELVCLVSDDESAAEHDAVGCGAYDGVGMGAGECSVVLGDVGVAEGVALIVEVGELGEGGLVGDDEGEYLVELLECSEVPVGDEGCLDVESDADVMNLLRPGADFPDVCVLGEVCFEVEDHPFCAEGC